MQTVFVLALQSTASVPADSSQSAMAVVAAIVVIMLMIVAGMVASAVRG